MGAAPHAHCQAFLPMQSDVALCSVCVYLWVCVHQSDNHLRGPPSSLSVLHELCSICRSILLLGCHNVWLNNATQILSHETAIRPCLHSPPTHTEDIFSWAWCITTAASWIWNQKYSSWKCMITPFRTVLISLLIYLFCKVKTSYN